MPDKMSQEKISLLRAFGAEVSSARPRSSADSPESYYSVSDRLAEEIPGAFKPNQYANAANPQAHYETTGPEIWEQTGGELDALVIAVGTGGTISGSPATSRSASPICSSSAPTPRARSTPPRTMHPYLVEGIGEDFWPDDVRPVAGRRVRDGVRPRLVPDRPAHGPRGGPARRRLGRHRGVRGARGGRPLRPDATIVTLIPDGGRAYLSKFFNDNYMLEYGFLERHDAGADGRAGAARQARRASCPSWSRSRPTTRSARRSS